jgi:tripartite-type tricarboxylate transporter receptor subunit TctC
MNFRPRRLLQLVATAIAAVVSSGFAWAQNYPTRPITMIVGYAVGGPTDTIARIMAERMSMSLEQPLVVENVTGASGSIGVARVARAAPDGYTLSLGDWSTHVANGAAYTLSYDLLTDFRPVALLPSNPMLVLARKGIPADTLDDLIAWLKTNSRNASLASSGAGSPPHVAGAYFQSLTGTHIPMVPYRGAAPALLDLIAGRTDLSITQASFALPQVREGKVKAYAGKLNSAVVDALADPSVRHRLAEMGEEIPPREQQTPEALGALQRAEIEKWWPIIKAMGMRAE